MIQDNMHQKAIIAGAGPAGLTTAYELLNNTEIEPLVLEASSKIGGISQTINYKGNRMDIGGHRFFSKSKRVMDWWETILPLQGAPSLDDLLLERPVTLQANGPDPSETDRVMLFRNRISRIYYLRSFFDYPISLKWQTFANMGLGRTIRAGFGYLASTLHKRPENSLEDFYINRFGKPLYKMFFEGYTEKVWGIHPSRLGADWGSQRVKGLSVGAVLADVFRKAFHIKGKQVETSLIESFIYPKLGPGHLWETVASEVSNKGGEIRMEAPVKEVHIQEDEKGGRRVDYVVYEHPEKGPVREECDWFFSSMPIKDLIASLSGIDVPEEVKAIAGQLRYRDFITVGLLVDELTILNKTKIPTYKGRIPDTWIYIQERDVKLGRLQIFNNWSPYLVEDFKDKVWIGLEYFCDEGDDLWSMGKEEFIRMAISELEHIGIISADKVVDSTQVKIKKAYPTYYGSYYQLDKVISFLDTIENLFCIGRNGQHRYNNMDHSMLTGMTAVDSIKDGSWRDKTPVWCVNTEGSYHESAK